MNVLRILEKEIHGKCFGSRRYNVDTLSLSPLAYDESPKMIYKIQGETEKHKSYINLEILAKRMANSDPILRFFLDGSRHTYKIDDIALGNNVYPIVAGQIGVGCCRRDNKRMFPQHLYREFVLVLPSVVNKDGNNDELFFNLLMQKLNASDVLKRYEIEFGKILYYHTRKDEDSEKLAIAKIQDRMVELEKIMVKELTEQKLLASGAYLLKDGSLEYKMTRTEDPFHFDKIRNNYRHVIGVSKSFNPDLAKSVSGQSNAKFIAELPLYSRTPAFMYSSEISGEERYAIWYLRIRGAHINSPFDGILKVEKVLISERERQAGLSSEEIDTISANLINERNPACYGADERWANHIYPVFLTESFVKSKYLSTEFFINIF
ncbi:MAG: hypothetical protein PHH77_00980 [Victivallaceae bacterium]|nr:hypothetical protein [Victivallaceae bacterium]